MTDEEMRAHGWERDERHGPGKYDQLCRGCSHCEPFRERLRIVEEQLEALLHLAPPVTASGGNAETTEERAPQPPAEQPQRRLPPDDDS